MYKVISLIIGMAFGCNAMAAPGETALDFLNLPVGATEAALGHGNYAGYLGPEALFGNPALIGSANGAFASHQELLLDTRSEAAAAVLRLTSRFSLGVAMHFFSPGYIEGYSEDNTKTGGVDAGDRLIRVAVAKNGDISWGLAASFYNEKLANRVGNGFGLGAGMSMQKGPGRFGANIDNLGPEFKVGESSTPLPTRYSLSAWVPIHNGFWNLNFDIAYINGPGFLGSLGMEYIVLDGLALRAGGNNQDPLSLGLGIKSGKLSFDYAYIPLSSFGDRHIISASFTK